MAGNVVPTSVDRPFLEKVSNFPDTVYNLYPTDKLTILLETLLGGSGTGQLSLVQSSAQNTQNLWGVEFGDLDDIVGSLVRTNRLPNEQYGLLDNPNPYIDQLTSSNWDSIGLGDAFFRERLGLMLTAINSGATVLGVTLAAEAILGCKVRVLEQWRYNPSLTPGVYPFKTTSLTEFAIVPLLDGFTITAISSTSSTLSFTVKNNFTIGQQVIVSGCTPSAYNGVWTVDTATPTGFTVWDSSNPGTGTTLGMVSPGLTQDQAGAVIEMIELLKPNSSIATISQNAGSSEILLTTKQTVADSEWFEFDKLVSTGTINPTVNPINQASFPTQYWLDPSQAKIAPIFAHRRASEESIDVTPNVATITAIIYPQPNDLSQSQPITPPGTQRNVMGGTNYGPWNSVGLADSPDNFPGNSSVSPVVLPGKYPGDPNHYNVYTTTYSGSTATLQSITSSGLIVSSTIPSSIPTSGTGSVTATSGEVYTFNYTGVSGSTFTGCTFIGDEADTLSNSTVVNIELSYNFEYPSQTAYVNYLQKMVTKLGGEFNSSMSQYRLPTSNTYGILNPITIQEVLLSPPVKIVATAYGAL